MMWSTSLLLAILLHANYVYSALPREKPSSNGFLDVERGLDPDVQAWTEPTVTYPLPTEANPQPPEPKPRKAYIQQDDIYPQPDDIYAQPNDIYAQQRTTNPILLTTFTEETTVPEDVTYRVGRNKLPAQLTRNTEQPEERIDQRTPVTVTNLPTTITTDVTEPPQTGRHRQTNGPEKLDVQGQTTAGGEAVNMIAFFSGQGQGQHSHSVSQGDVDRLIDQLFIKSPPLLLGQGLLVNEYYLSRLYMNADSAQRACVGLGGDLAEVNSQREYDFVKDFATPHMRDHVPVTISGYSIYAHSIPGNFRSSHNVNITGLIDDVIRQGRIHSYDEGGRNNTQYPLLTDFFPDRPGRAESPSCLGLSHRSWLRRGDQVRMTNEKCRAAYRFLCEVASV